MLLQEFLMDESQLFSIKTIVYLTIMIALTVIGLIKQFIDYADKKKEEGEKEEEYSRYGYMAL